jgi:membrane protein DedA with SNARE-associated domain
MEAGGWLSQYGYLAIFVGVFFEGELVVMAAGVAARHGLLHPAGVVAAALAGALVGDIGFFLVGKKWGMALIRRRASWQAAYERAVARMAGRLDLFAFGVRFLYGMRNIAAVTVGVSGINAGRFLALNMAGALLWAVLLTTLGYAFGEVAVEWARKALARWSDVLMVGLGVVLVVGSARMWRRRRSSRGVAEGVEGEAAAVEEAEPEEEKPM